MLIFINSGLRVSDYSVLKITIGKSHKIFEKFLLICFIATSYDFWYSKHAKPENFRMHTATSAKVFRNILLNHINCFCCIPRIWMSALW